MKLNNTRRSFLIKSTAVSAAVVFPSMLIAKEEKGSTKAITHTVEIEQFKFKPEKLEIKLGDSIRWVNRDIVPHTATAIDKSWDTGEILHNESKALTFSKDAKNPIIEYYCFYHPSMKAKITITVFD